MTGLQPEVVDRDLLASAFAERLASGGRLAITSCHEDGDRFRIVHTFVSRGARVDEVAVSVAKDDPWVPSLAALSYPAGRFEREIRDLYGVVPTGHPLPRRLVRHGHWPTGWYPMRSDADANPTFEPDTGSFPFLEVEGQGVYEIPVGPVHAGMIEPGHFRFSVVGETILRMKARLWFVHRGVEKLFEGRTPAEGIELAERISGDTAVGHTLAFVQAVEQAAGLEVDPRDRLVRALLLELERLYNHVGDLGALANDVGFGVANAHALRLREALMRHNDQTTGHRLLRGGITIGGARLRALPDPATLVNLAAAVAELVEVTLGHSVVRDRFTGAAVLPHAQAVALGTLGYVARASGVDVDARRDFAIGDLELPGFEVAVETAGDVLARYLVRAREVATSAAVAANLVRTLDGDLGTGAIVEGAGAGAGLGVVEAWRGELVHRVELDGAGKLSRVKVVDPSFVNWPALPVSLADTIVPDFPLANKSFNQSYAGNDL